MQPDPAHKRRKGPPTKTALSPGTSSTPHMKREDADIPMLRKITPFGKLFLDEETALYLYNIFCTGFRMETETCPCCKSAGNCCIHGYYKRRLVDYFKGEIIVNRIRVLRVMCKTCGHTHAVLPDIIVPYAQYTIRFICRAVSEKLTTTSTVEAVCEKFDISTKTLHRFLDIYKEHKALWLGSLKSKETTHAQFLSFVGSTYERFSDFMCAFSRRFVFSFMQVHANPVNTCQRPNWTANTCQGRTKHMYVS